MDELTDEQRRILDDAVANSGGDEIASIRVDGPHFFEITWKRSGYSEGFQIRDGLITPVTHALNSSGGGQGVFYNDDPE